ncbi:hypothetical protein CDAR_204361 [Caerostris darwini]|uniref:Uncharacterized protein n=1 Tax=Caerostris darwini TaxID=1538125 RepID=A0AAV4USP5_9ARAC|nr:hypothetical protein CDAR_204361 [Caerostris darwini]
MEDLRLKCQWTRGFLSSTRESSNGLQPVIGTEKDPRTGWGWVSIDLEDRGFVLFPLRSKEFSIVWTRGFFSSTRESTNGLQTVIGTEKDPRTGWGWVSIDLEDRDFVLFSLRSKEFSIVW